MQAVKGSKVIDQMISDLGGTELGLRSQGPCGLLLEHLRSARTALLGAMHSQYVLSLEQAEDSIACVPNKNLRADMKSSLRALVKSEEARIVNR